MCGNDPRSSFDPILSHISSKASLYSFWVFLFEINRTFSQFCLKPWWMKKIWSWNKTESFRIQTDLLHTMCVAQVCMYFLSVSTWILVMRNSRLKLWNECITNKVGQLTIFSALIDVKRILCIVQIWLLTSYYHSLVAVFSTIIFLDW